jgi:hypothetical protein
MTDIAPFPRPSLSLRNLRLSLPVARLAKGGVQLAQRVGLAGLSDRRLKSALDLPVLAMDPAETGVQTVRAQVSALAGQADLADLFDLIAQWDRTRAATPMGRRKARIAADALRHLALPGTPDHPVAAALTALNACASAGDLVQAQAALDRFDAAEFASPLLAEAHYRLGVALGDHAAISLAHDDWADLDPGDDAVWASHGAALLASGSHAAVAAAAARAEWQTERWLGKGGYALFLLPVMPHAPVLWDRIDPERLAAATLDLARHRHRDQGTVNRIAADWARLTDAAPAEWRGLLRTSYRQMLEESLNTLLPAAWAMPEPAARRRIAEAFLPELRAGACLRATPAGLALCDRSAP